MSLFHLWAAYDIVPTTILRPVHVGFALVLIFLLFPIVPRFRNRIQPWDLLFAAVSIATIWYLIQGGDDLTDRASLPNSTDQIFGVIFILLVLEATRRSTGWIMPAVAVGFIVYALVGPSLPAPGPIAATRSTA